MNDRELIWESYLSMFTETTKKQTIVGVEYPKEISNEQKIKAFENLSEVEKSQLGTKNFVSREDWPYFREYMVRRSVAGNPKTDIELTAYTAGETWNLFQNPIIKNWHETIVSHIIPNNYDVVVFVPCAKTKPWENACRGTYKSYNALKKEYDNLYFVTISEPLAIVPMDLWSEFPQYDNPGLFSDPVQRCGGLHTKDWTRLFGVKSRLQTPFDKSLQIKCIHLLGNIIKRFIVNNRTNNPNLKFISFVEDFKKGGTHSLMLDVASELDQSSRFFKREKERAQPEDYLRSVLKQKGYVK